MSFSHWRHCHYKVQLKQAQKPKRKKTGLATGMTLLGVLLVFFQLTNSDGEQ